MTKKLLFLMALLLPMGVWADDDEKVIAERDWTGPIWLGDAEEFNATSKLTADGLEITNPSVQEDYWKPQAYILEGITLQKGHSYKVMINAKIPADGDLSVQLGTWENGNFEGGIDYVDKFVPVKASTDFKNIEVIYDDFPVDAINGHVVFQNGLIKGTCVVKYVKVTDITRPKEGYFEETFHGPYWFDGEGVGATYEMTAEGLAITNPKVQAELWTVQTQIIKNAPLRKGHTYKVIVNAKIPSDGELQVNLGNWADNGVINNLAIPVKASSDFQDYVFVCQDYQVDAVGESFVLFQNGGIAGTCVVKNVQVVDITDSEEIIASNKMDGPYWYDDEGVGATYEMTAEGLAITNPKVQAELWTVQTQVLQNAKLEKNHAYKIIVNAKIPSDGELQVNLGNWADDGTYNIISIPVEASNDFQDYEFVCQDFPINADNGFVLFQNGGIAGTCILNYVQVVDITNGDEYLRSTEGDLTGSYWFGDEETGATCVTTAEGIAITNPKVQENLWTPQSQVIQNAKFEKDHTYKVVVNAKIPSDGLLQIQLGTWGQGVCIDKSFDVKASDDFQDFEVVYEDFTVDAKDGHVLFQNGGIAGTCVVKNVKVIDLGIISADLVYNYNDEDLTAEVIKNPNRAYIGDVIIPATVKHNGKDYTVTSISKDAFQYCKSMNSLHIPATLTKVEGQSFLSCISLKKITVDPNNPVYDSRNNCNAIIQKESNELVLGCLGTVVPEGVTRIAWGAFWGNWDIKNLHLPNTVKSIEDGAFACCFSFESIDLPSSLESIGAWTFQDSGLKSITIPASVTSIRALAFDKCKDLKSVISKIPDPTKITFGQDVFKEINNNAILYVPQGTIDAYTNQGWSKYFAQVLEEQSNTLSPTDLSTHSGNQPTLSIVMNNYDKITAMQFDLVLPKGITVASDQDGLMVSLSNRAAASHTVAKRVQEDGAVRIVCSSNSSVVFSGNAGTVVLVKLNVSKDLANGEYQVKVKNIELSSEGGEAFHPNPTEAKIKVGGVIMGDVDSNGSVTVNDAVWIVRDILGITPKGFVSAAADLDGSGKISVNDKVVLINHYILGKSKARTRAAGEEKPATLSIANFFMQPGETRTINVMMPTDRTDIEALQCDIYLPQGLTFVAKTENGERSYASKGERATNSHSISSYIQEDGALRVVESNDGGTAFKQNDKAVFSFAIKASDDVKVGNHIIRLANMELSYGEPINPADIKSTVTITVTNLGDANNDGEVDKADILALVDLIMSNTYYAKADMNKDGKVNAADLVLLTNTINKK